MLPEMMDTIENLIAPEPHIPVWLSDAIILDPIFSTFSLKISTIISCSSIFFFSFNFHIRKPTGN